MLNLHDKLVKLKKLDDLVVFRWTAGHKRIANDYILLSNVRLTTLSCNGGKVIYSSAAACVYNVKGRPVVSFRDRDLVTIISGSNRMGINIPSSMLKPGEEAAQTRYCEWRVVDEDHCPKWLEQRIMSMATGCIYPCARLNLPDISRISKKPETLKPIFSADLIRLIDGKPTDTTEQLLDKFHQNLRLFGTYNNDGYIIPNDYICAGGCCVVGAKGIPATNGSVVFTMPLRAFDAECARRHWTIATAANTEV